MFSKTPELNYEGDKFKTYWGGIATILGFVTLFSYFIYILVILFQRSEMKVNTKYYARDVAQDETAYYPAHQGLEIAFTLKSTDYKHLPNLTEFINNHTLFFQAYQIEITGPKEIGGQAASDFHVRRLGVESCEKNSRMKSILNNASKKASDYFWISDKDYYIKGNRFSNKRGYLELILRSCHFEGGSDYYQEQLDQTTCKSYDDLYQNITKDYFIELAIVDSYFENEKFGDKAISNYLTEKYLYTMRLQERVDIDIYVQENEVKLKDSLLPFKNFEEERLFFNIISDRSFSRKVYDNQTQFSVHMAFRLDQEKTRHQRTVYSISNALSEVGGLYGIIQPTIALVIAYFVDILFNYAILSKVCQVHKGRDEWTTPFGYKDSVSDTNRRVELNDDADGPRSSEEVEFNRVIPDESNEGGSEEEKKVPTSPSTRKKVHLTNNYGFQIISHFHSYS